MKRLGLLAAVAAVAVTSVGGAPAVAQRVVAVVGDPGPGWTVYRDHRSYRAGPAYYTGRGEHHGWYHYNNSYYQNCSWRNGNGHHHDREWRCW